MTTAERQTVTAPRPRAAETKIFAGPTPAKPQAPVATPAGRYFEAANGRCYRIPSTGPDSGTAIAGLRPVAGLTIGLSCPIVTVERLIPPRMREVAG